MTSDSSLGRHLRVFYKSLQFFRFLDCTFNSSTRRMVYNHARSKVSRRIFKVLHMFSATISTVTLVILLILYLNTGPSILVWESVETQEKMLLTASNVMVYVEIFMLTRNYLYLGHMLLPSVNEMFEIFELLERKTDSRIFFMSSFSWAIGYKVSTSVLCILSDIKGNLLLVFLGFNIFCPYGQVLSLLTFLGYLYAQLLLVCFYMKMNRFLDEASVRVDEQDLHDLLAISFRINQLKRELNTFFSAMYLSTYLGLFADVKRLYDILKVVFYYKFPESRILKLLNIVLNVNWKIPFTLTVTYDIYLIGRLSDVLVQAERIFKWKMRFLNSRQELLGGKSTEEAIELLMFRSNVCDLSSRACRVIKMDQQLTFHYIMNIIFMYVINCLQFYASKRVYLWEK